MASGPVPAPETSSGTGAEFVCNDITDDGYIWGPVDTKTSMRNLLAQTAETAKQAKDVADGAAQAIAAVQNTISVIPSQSGGLTYNGSAQRPSWNNYAVEMMEVTYGDPDDPEARITEADFQGQTDAGTYMAYFKPKGDYTWGDKSKTEKAVPWSIQRATITTAPSVTGTLTYNGGAQTPTWQSFNSAQLTKEETAQTNAGTYSTAFTPTKNYQWSGGDTSAKQIHPAHSPGRPQGQQVRWGAGHQELLPLYPHPAADLGAGPENQG